MREGIWKWPSWCPRLGVSFLLGNIFCVELGHRFFAGGSVLAGDVGRDEAFLVATWEVMLASV